MSTRVTKKDIPMVESQSLQLFFSAAEMNEQISLYLSNALKDRGYESVTPCVLKSLSALECGINYSSEIARSLGISRQVVAKKVKELCSIGYLEQVDGKGKQKQILFTELGERLMSDSRQLLAELDEILCETIDRATLEETVERLKRIQAVVLDIDKD
ncbi:MarR family transcriptional regulator [Hyella patelloides LEGE 07179]|uniref:MarR family transcriptional regulator n=1 Tax=Hyella patelloides LEGE 07179 TaxID=945734 RepID=A0A563VQG6_9CYAN|nr:MarR family transcriptional regulator [Hyella patelloides]VEP13673.1 MarR family transcriptional regulator [Hyella patelloides LEGE 07179]